MAASPYEKYIRRDVRSKTAQEQHPEVPGPVLGLKSDATFGNKNFALSWWPISQPFEMVKDTHAHDFDQFLMFVGGDINNMLDLGGEVELTLGEEGKPLEKVVFTTGGTGVSPRDVTPDATMEVIEKQIPGMAEVMRRESSRITPHAMISRAIAGIRGSSLIINLPGSPKGATENLAAIMPALKHAIEKIKGDTSECATTS